MNKNRKMILSVFFVIIVVFTLLKIYVLVFETNYQNLNIESIGKIQTNLMNKTQYSFGVIGNVENSLDIFEKRIIPQMDDLDFVVFAGDFLLDGGENKYGAFYKTSEKFNVPAVFAVGDNEVSDFGTKRFYRHFGPYFFSFDSADSYFIFLDSTGTTSEELQKVWLTSELQNAKKYKNRFIIQNQELENSEERFQELLGSEYKLSDEYTSFLKKSFSEYNITMFISSSRTGFNATVLDGVNYISSGGGGGLLLKKDPDYNFIKVIVNPQKTRYEFIKISSDNVSVAGKLWNTLWFRFHSWLYIGYINFILVWSIIFFVIFMIYSKLIETPDFYPKCVSQHKSKKRLTIVMFTNNYLPFIGGVPISIARLKKGLERLGHTVYVFSPKYNDNIVKKNIIQCKPLFYYKKRNLKVPITNIFSTKIKKEFLKISPDIVHVHHPYWLGSVGHKLAVMNKIPIVYTYHTRIEQYNHYFPLFKKLAGGRLPHMLIKKFSNKCNAIIAPTKSAKAYLRNLGVGRTINIIPTGVDMAEFEMSDNDSEKLKVLNKKFRKKNELILFSVFRLSKEKNPYFLLEGVKKVKENTDTKFRCLIVGTGPEEKKIRDFIEKNNLTDTVHLLGKIRPESIALYYQLADIFIFSSKSETQGMVLLEAMAGSSPVVAIESSGTDDVIVDEKNGYKTKDDLGEWCSKILYLMENKAALNRMSIQAHEFSKSYSIESMAEKVLKLYRKIMSE